MPTYQYKCPKCGHEYEKFQNITDNSRPKCAYWGTRGVRVMSGGGGVLFKGSGFYLADYGSAGQSKAESESESSDKRDAKPDKPEKVAKPDKPAEKPKKS